MKIYHNPRCRKSRETLGLIEQAGIEPEIVLYLENPPTVTELNELIRLLGISAADLVRRGEAVWKERYKGKQLSDEEIIVAMTENTKLIERPIVVKDGQAILGRPPENVEVFL